MQRSWAEICCLGCSCLQLYWVRLVLRKWLNITAPDSDFSADTDEEDDLNNIDSDYEGKDPRRRESIFRAIYEDGRADANDARPILRRRNSATTRAQCVDKKEIRICVGTWNVAGKAPPYELDIDGWIDTTEPADIYVLGLQEIVPLNASNIFGAEDNGPVSKWENIIRDALNRVRPKKSRTKSYSDPPSPSKFKPSEDNPDIEELTVETDSDTGQEIHQLGEKSNKVSESTVETGGSSEKTPFCSSNHHVSGRRPASLKSIKSFYASKPFQTYSSFQSTVNQVSSAISLLSELDFESLAKLKIGESYVRIASKQMVGIFLTIWVRGSLRKHIQNLRVSTVGVGALGYIGNKGSVSVSMSIYQRPFCFVCTHLTSGERSGDETRRNADVHEILKRTQFLSSSATGVPMSIHDHENIIWLGDLNYRINLSYEETCELIARKQWQKLIEKDQLFCEMESGRVFDGWSEGTLAFPPTYKYEFDSERYCGEDTKAGKRTPAWCDRILSYGKGLKLLSYRRTELNFSDHRPVTATYMAELEVFSSRKLRRAFTSTDAESEIQ